MMKNKILALGLTLLMTLGLLAGCSAASLASPVDAPTLGAAVAAADDSLPEMVTNTSADADAELNFSAVCTVDYSRVEGFYHSYAKDGSADEVIVVLAKDSSDVTAILNGLKDHQNTRKGTMEEYSPEEVATVESGVLTYTGRYIGLFISDKVGTEKQAFEEELAKYGIQ